MIIIIVYRLQVDNTSSPVEVSSWKASSSSYSWTPVDSVGPDQPGGCYVWASLPLRLWAGQSGPDYTYSSELRRKQIPRNHLVLRYCEQTRSWRKMDDPSNSQRSWGAKLATPCSLVNRTDALSSIFQWLWSHQLDTGRTRGGFRKDKLFWILGGFEWTCSGDSLGKCRR